MLIVYTAGAKSQFDAAGKSVATAITNAVGQINSALAFSKIDLRVTPVYTGQVDYKNAINLNDDLDQIRDGDAGKGIRDLQDAHSADVVALIREKGPDRDGTSFMLQNDGLDYSDSGIEVVGWYCVDEGYKCLAHEFGHLLGAAHDRKGLDVYGWSRIYSFGHCFQAADGYYHGDLMAYDCADRREVLYSDPLSLFKSGGSGEGVPTGVPELNAAGQQNTDPADNARTVRETKRIVSNYRISH